MSKYRYILEDYKGPASRYTCPGCGKQKQFTRYVDTTTGECLPERYGKCNREDKCGYYQDPYKDGYAKNIGDQDWANNKQAWVPSPVKYKPLVCIPFDILKQSRIGYENNISVQNLLRLFSAEIVNDLIAHFHIGSSKRWPGSVVFWFIDSKGRIRAGQIKLFDETNHTAKYLKNDGEWGTCTTSVNSTLAYNYEKAGEALPQWLIDYRNQDLLFSCFFGEHQLNDRSGAPVAIVEAPKSAIIASVYFPQFVWLAVGALSYLTFDRCQVLKGRKVILFPDVNCFDKWKDRIEKQELDKITSFKVSDYLEKEATDEDRKQSADIADYLSRYDYNEFTSSLTGTRTQRPLGLEPGALSSPCWTRTLVQTKNDFKPITAPLLTEATKCKAVADNQPENEPQPQPVPQSAEKLTDESFTGVSADRNRIPVRELQKWDLTELEAYYSAITIPAGPVTLRKGHVIIDPEKFINGHLSIVRNNNGNNTFLPFMHRLQHLMEIL